MCPIFDTASINRILSGDKVNVYTEMRKRTKNIEILKVLEVAELQNA